MADSPKKTPDELLEELGIKEPSQLKIEAIAFHCQAIILYEPLTGCEANIVGKGDRAIITVNSNAIPTRQRFSAGHELGHWMKDRGQSAFGCTILVSRIAGINVAARAIADNSSDTHIYVSGSSPEFAASMVRSTLSLSILSW